MKFAYIDGDDIGLKIENCFMNNDETQLANINNEISSITRELKNFFKQNGYTVIFGGADGIIIRKADVDIKNLLQTVRAYSKNYTFSIGVGDSLRKSYIALRYAKSNGKNVAAFYDSQFTLFR